MSDESRLAPPPDDREISRAGADSPVDFDVRTIVANLTASLGRAAREKGLTFVTEVAADVPSPLMGAARLVEQALHGLVSRALRVTSAGGVALAVRCVGAGPDAAEIEFVVRDTGRGLTGEEVRALLEPQEALGAHGHDETDAGVARSRRVIERLGGTITLDRPLGQGTALGWTARFKRGQRTARERVRGARVLVVEDNIINQMLAEEILRSAGVVVTLADDGAVALTLLARHPFDLVLMDVQMPRMDGFEATRRLRQLPTLAGLPVIAMTASTLPEEIARCREVGMNDVVSKPMLPEEFIHTLARWLP
jgi:CheY-like chemotaxis protein